MNPVPGNDVPGNDVTIIFVRDLQQLNPCFTLATSAMAEMSNLAMAVQAIEGCTIDEVRQLQALLAARTGLWLPPTLSGSDMTQGVKDPKDPLQTQEKARTVVRTKGTGVDKVPKKKGANQVSPFNDSPLYKTAKAVAQQIQSALKSQNAKHFWDLKDIGLIGQHLKARADLDALKQRSRAQKAKAAGTPEETLAATEYWHPTLLPLSPQEAAKKRARLASQAGMLTRRCGGRDKIMANDDACKAFITHVLQKHRVSEKDILEAPSLKGDQDPDHALVPAPNFMQTYNGRDTPVS